MPDSKGKPLRAGEPVIYEHPDGTADATATILRVGPGGRYLIQLDPIQPRSPDEHPRLKQYLDAEASRLPRLAPNPGDLQEPFEVDGSCLYLLESNEEGIGRETSGALEPPDRSDYESAETWLEAVDAWLIDPDVEARNEVLARLFRMGSVDTQIPVLETSIKNDESSLEQLLMAMADPELPIDVRAKFEELRVAIEDLIRRARERIIVLKLDGPDDY